MDILIIGYFLTSEFVAAYEVAWRVSGVVVILSRSVSLSIFPRVSEWSVDDAVDEISRVMTDAMTASLMICIPAFFGTVFLSTEILQFVFGEEYTIAALAMVILIFEKTFQSVHKVWGYSLQAIDRPDQAASAAVISIGVNIVLNLLLVPAYGLEGAATATATSFLLNTALHARYLSRSVPIRIEWNKIGWSILSAVIMSTIVYVASEMINIDSIVILFVLVAIGIVTYFAILPIYSPIRTDLRTVVLELT
jgi:O-antigen/teichoic acid export membrane protein